MHILLKAVSTFLLLSALSVANATIATEVSSDSTGKTEFSEYQFTKVGEAELSVLFWSIYNSTLYSLDGSFNENQRPLKLEINYFRDIEAADLISKTAEEWMQQGLNHHNQELWLQQLTNIWPNIKEDDTLTFIVDEHNNSYFLFNKQNIGHINDQEFANHFLAIWLSEKTSRPKLRTKLLGITK
ncbi:chalcone isomerase family protein [Thalassomonas sp. M1454]|uniref:chalcone isomerase family protein n=1 Tax=Thalassomonas sp. M1454 TaxID=2594477 RepID=UPI00117E3E99|nr:chalcone isomerase family protein [Thalassomonas sp. M1454]TRX55052.1 hypothetical protein FNN08_10655 [Thalassomonas sp. M1454]